VNPTGIPALVVSSMSTASLSARSIGPRGLCLGSALLGGAAEVGAALLWPRWEVAMFLLGPLVVVPLGLALAAPGAHERFRRPWWAAALLQFPAALLLLAAFSLHPGRPAALLSLPWLAVTLLTALFGLARLLRRGPRPLEELAIDAGLIYLAVGGGWLVLARAGIRPLGFDPLIVLLTAVHFHYAGFVLPLLTGMVGRAWPGLLSRGAAVGVIAGVPLVAVGINLSQLNARDFEPWAATLLAAAGLLVAALHLVLAAGRRPLGQRLLLAVAGLSLPVGMVLAMVYAWGRYSGLPWIEIPEMLPYHGAVNALGFALPGLVGWNLAVPAPHGDVVASMKK
jgi:hypothetical protein